MLQTQETLLESLKNAGMRITPQRVAICKLLSENTDHPTAAVVYQAIRRQFPSISLATVYNTLETLARLSIINVIGSAGDNNIHYDADTDPHIHLSCVSCHRITDFAPTDLLDITRQISNSGFRIIGARVAVYGHCPTCQSIHIS